MKIKLSELRPMSESPRDGVEVLAYTAGEPGSFHPVVWKRGHHEDHGQWGTNWNNLYSKDDRAFLGWIPYPVLDSTGEAYIVELEEGVWIAPWSEPSYTLTKSSSRRFKTEERAKKALEKVRRDGNKKFTNARILLWEEVLGEDSNA